MPDELDDEERALLEKHRAAKKKAAEDDRDVWIREGDHEASVPYSKARKWLQEKFGIDLDAEPVQDPEGSPDPKPDETPERVVRFGGRRIS